MTKRELFGGILLVLITTFVIEPIATPLKIHLFEFFGNIILTFYENFKDQVYSEVSKGFHPQPTTFILLLLFSGFVGLFIGKIIRIIKKNKDKITQINSNRIADAIIGYSAIIYLIFLICYVLFLSLTTSYINRAVKHFDNLMIVNSPSLDIQKEKQLRSKFTQIRSQNDYSIIIGELENMASSENRKFYPFDSW